MSILLRVERESGGQPIELGDGQITGYSYINTSPSDFFAKAYNAEHSVQIRGEIPLRLLPPVEQDADNSNTLYAWALTEYRPDNDYYRSVTVQIVRHEKTIREVKFTHAYVHVYQEQVDGLKGVLEFELVVRQRRDQLDSIQFGSVKTRQLSSVKEKRKPVTILESEISENEFPFSYALIEESTENDQIEKYKTSNSFAYEQFAFLKKAYEASFGDDKTSKSMRKQIQATVDYLKYVVDNGSNYAIISLDTFLPVDKGTDPWGDTYLGNGEKREFGVNNLNVKTLQYGVVNLDYNSVVGFNFVTITERINEQGEVIKTKRDSNSEMFFTSNLNKKGNSNFTMVNIGTSAGNELSLGAPPLDYSASVKILNKSIVSISVQTDKFPSYEGYISINGGSFNKLYNLKAIPAPINPFLNLAVPRGTYTNKITYEK
ncbi:DUF3238 domain-containing protein [Paenibacillus elgii]|uniref:DUF3238 domain-containing protein n=1 Tax=Paenibacillus elgii TaxID=189691 RepID=UPI00203EFBAE|nr:DUF3238 domain-containing protein [Paenibacillus elgii]MCM3271786.1 DUF3238 domain-containing protein [Paenibacillus elgii]